MADAFLVGCRRGTLQQISDVWHQKKYRKIYNIGFYLACRHGHLEVVRLFLDTQSPQILALHTGLLTAIKFHRVDIIMEIITRRVELIDINDIIDIISTYGLSYMIELTILVNSPYADLHTSLISVIKLNSTALTQLLVDRGANNANEAIMEAARLNCMCSARVLVNYATCIGPAFVTSCSSGHKYMAVFLIDHITEERHFIICTGLQSAILIGNLEIIYLIRNHTHETFSQSEWIAMLDAAIKNGRMVLFDYIIHQVPDQSLINWNRALCIAVSFDRMNMIERIVLENPRETPLDWMRPLMLACQESSFTALCYILDNEKVHPYVVRKNAGICLNLVCASGQMASILRYLEYMETIDIDLDLTMGLLGACVSNREDIVDFILERGRQSKIYKLNIEYVLMHVCKRGLDRILEKLLAALPNKSVIQTLIPLVLVEDNTVMTKNILRAFSSFSSSVAAQPPRKDPP